MPRNGSGVYTLPAGNPVEPGTTIDSAWANDTLEDIANELTNSLSRTGAGGMVAPFRIADGNVTAPGLAFTNETNSGLYRSGAGSLWMSVLGVNTVQFTTTGVNIPAGKTVNLLGGITTTTLDVTTSANIEAPTLYGRSKIGVSTGSESLRVPATASAVNYARIYGNVTGSGPVIDAQGADTNVDLNLAAKGTGSVAVLSPLALASTLSVTGAITATGGVSGQVTSSNAVLTGGTINNMVIGGSTPQTITGTTITSTVGFVGPLTGNVTGNTAGTHTGPVVGNVTGNVTGSLTGNVTGNVTAASGTSTFENVTINGSLDMNSATGSTITGLSTPTGSTDAANKGYVDNQVASRLALAGGTMTGAIAMSNNKVTGLGTPTADQDAATKAYVDSIAQGIDAKASCLAATTANITLSGTQTIDGVAVAAGQRVLVKNQANAAQNGIYVSAAGAWTRAADADTWDELVSAYTFIEQGTDNGNNGYICTVTAGGTLGTTPVTWVQFSGAGQINAGAGLTKVGNTIDVVTASSSRIVVNPDNIDLATTGVSAGTYKSVTIDAYGRVTAGTNPTTLSGYGITDAYTTTQVDTLVNAKLSLTGGTMSGAIAMGTNKITGLGDPTNAQDAATKNYIDTLFGSTTSAAASAAAAATSASNAATSATNASNSATAAAGSATNAAATYTNFNNQYLGSKSSDPTVNNTGGALSVGNLYWNSTFGEMRVYTGSAWLAAYIPATGYLQLSGGTMTGTINFAAGQTIAGYLTTASAASTYQTQAAMSSYLTSATAASTYLALAGGTLTGNLAFSGTGRRITGDFSNATFTNRTLFQTSTANGNTQIGLIPNGTSVNSAFFAYNNADPTNASTAALRVNASEAALISGITGTGTYLPLAFLTSNSEAARFATSGNFLIGGTTDNGTDKLQVTGSMSLTSTVRGGAGSAGAPTFSVASDTNTGIFFPAADTIGFAEGGVEAARITSTGAWSFGASGTATGTAGQVLTSQGAGAAPTWTDASTVTIDGPTNTNLPLGVGAIFTITNYDSFTTYTLSTTNGTVTRSGATITYTPSNTGAAGFVINGRTISGYTAIVPAGQQAYTTAGTYSWTCPAGVTSVSVVCVGGGGGNAGGGASAGGGGLGYKNNISVTPGSSYTVVVGAGGNTQYDSPLNNGGDSYFISTSIVRGGGGKGYYGGGGYAGGTYTGDGGGNGGSGGYNAGGGAGGYSGNGGNGSSANGTPGTDGAGGGGGGAGFNAGAGGGVGILGQGANGTGSTGSGNPGSGGSGVLYGGGGASNGGSGAVRIIWAGGSGVTRAFPSTNTGNL